MLDNREYRTLRKYQDGREIDDEDRDVLYKFSSLGMVSLGFSTTGEEPRETAKLNGTGARRVRREGIYRSPVKRFMYSLGNMIWR